jgi:trehalose-phosphatase
LDDDELLELLSADPPRSGIFCDFDGTLSVIVDRPQDARAVDGAAAVLAELARTFAVVAIVSGRSLEDLRALIAADGVVLAGSYGRERPGGAVAAPDRDWDEVARAAAATVPVADGVVVERKGAGVALHYRLAPGSMDDVVAAADTLSRRFGLEMRPGRMVVELTSPDPGRRTPSARSSQSTSSRPSSSAGTTPPTIGFLV